jgi:hypothetical protein
MAHLNEDGWIVCHPSSGGVYKAMQLLTKAEQRRLGWLLWKHGCLPDYWMLRFNVYKAATEAHLTAMQILLYEALMPPGSRHHESDLIQKLWQHESTTISQARLRKLTSRVNSNLYLADSEVRIARPETGFLVLRDQNASEDMDD